MQRIQAVVIVILLICLMGLAWNHIGAMRDNELRVVALLAKQQELLALLHASEIAETQRVGEIDPAQGHSQESKRVEAPHVSPFKSPEEIVERWLTRLLAQPPEFPSGYSAAMAILKELSPADATLVVSKAWSQFTDRFKLEMLKGFATRPGHPEILTFWNLGMTDSSLAVQNRAISYLRGYAFKDFSDDYEGYLSWHAEWGRRPLAEVYRVNAQAFVQGLLGRSLAETNERLPRHQPLRMHVGESIGIDAARLFIDAGALGLVEDWLVSGDRDAHRRATAWASALRPGEDWMRHHILPFVTQATGREDEVSPSSALLVLSDEANPWAVPSILAYMERAVREACVEGSTGAIFSAARALAGIGDSSTIPAMIGLIVSNPCYDTIYGIGYFGLGKMTGVPYDESHDGQWWVRWWQRNLLRFPPEVQATPIPAY